MASPIHRKVLAALLIIAVAVVPFMFVCPILVTTFEAGFIVGILIHASHTGISMESDISTKTLK